MESVKITTSIENVDWEQISTIFQSAGWGLRSPDKIRESFKTSSFVRIAFYNNQIVGFGRTVDDGQYYAMIVDLVVLPEFQGKGIGGRILKELSDELSGFNFTTLTASPGKEPFYLKQGWFKQKSAFILPRSNKQKLQHADES